MFSNKKVNCCRRRAKHNDEPCVPSSDPHYLRGENKPFKHPLQNHAMNNPEILSSFQAISGDIRGPEGCSNPGYDCYMTEQKRNYGHPLYQKMYMKTCQSQNYPVHYTVPPVDYHTYLQRQKEQMKSLLGRNFEQNCYTTTKDMEKVCKAEEFAERYRPGKPVKGVCPQCKAKKLRKSLPHCCSCRCAYYQKLGWQNVNPDCKQGLKNCTKDIVVMKALPLKKSNSNQNDGFDFGKTAVIKGKSLTDNGTCSKTDPGVVQGKKSYEGKNEMNQNCPPAEVEIYQVSTYREAYQSRKYKPFKSTSKASKSTSNLNDAEKSKTNPLEKPDWNKSIKLVDEKYVPNLASAEAKLEELDKILSETPLSSTNNNKVSSEARQGAKNRKNLVNDAIMEGCGVQDPCRGGYNSEESEVDI